ncbi:MAG: DEAD/DEAH box helicase [Oligoflexia bacterium]|nr:DEAD/DEAH box helicase [Oligoflexia bacterium]
MNWSNLSLSSKILKLVDDAGYKKPTPVQVQSIPLVVAGLDILVCSQTGSGKTASFVLPILERFKDKNGTYILALSPTREIALQTGAVFETFATPLGMKTVVCIGGVSISEEKKALSSSPHIIVATPGRLCDHLERGNVWLDFIQCIVFDEADRMLEMGFATQIEKIAEQLPKERQTLMYSATFAPKVEKLAKSLMNNPREVMIQNTKSTIPQIEQRLLWMDEGKKVSALFSLVRQELGTIIVFAKSKERVYQIWRHLQGRKIDSTYIHSDLTQEQRESTVTDFKNGKFRILIATDVMGRGIDVDNIAHVVNYDVPYEAEDYIHRIGRTARLGKTGIATTFAIPIKDEFAICAIEKILGVESPKSQQEKKEKEEPKKHDHQRKKSQNVRRDHPRR